MTKSIEEKSDTTGRWTYSLEANGEVPRYALDFVQIGANVFEQAEFPIAKAEGR